MIRPAQPWVHRAIQDDCRGAEAGSDVPGPAVGGDDDSRPFQHRLGEPEGQGWLVGQALHPRVSGRSDDGPGFIPVTRAAVHDDAACGAGLDQPPGEAAAPFDAPGLGRAVGSCR